MKKWMLILPISVILNSCALPLVLAGAAAGVGGSVYYDKRSAQTILADFDTKRKIENALAKDKNLKGHTSINASTYNGMVLLTGQAQTPQLRLEAEKVSSKIKGVRKIYNEVSISAPDAHLQNANDMWLTTKVKSELFSKQGLSSNELKIVTSNGSVYIMGKVTKKEGDKIADIVRRVEGVNRVVKVFEYSTYS